MADPMKALVLVDLQYDFMPGGALAVPHGDEVIAVANRLIPTFPLVVATQDWHPADHGSFAARHEGKKPGDVVDLNGLRQVLWAVHCVQDTLGAELHRTLAADRVTRIFQKGADKDIDSYSTFFDNAHRRSTGLAEYLQQQDVNEIYLLGLATDYCVKFSALDAVSLGLKTNVILDGCRGIDLHPGDIDRAIQEMKAAGVKMVTSESLQPLAGGRQARSRPNK